MEEAEDEPLFRERAAGIDIGKQTVMVTIRVPSETRKGGRAQETREFGTTRRQLLQLADWLRSWGVERAGMESTSDYWKPVYFLLEQQGFDCVLYPASKVKALPGRPKTDKLDSVWLAKITERAMLAAVIAGERNPRVLAEMARGVMRRKIARLKEALDCSFFTPAHAFVLSMMLENIDHYSAQIAVLDEKIAALCEPYQRQIAQLDQIPGFGVKNAQDLIGETGIDMTVFP